MAATHRVFLGYAAAFVALGLLVYLTMPSLQLMYSDWMVRPEYSHGILIPLITAYLLYQHKAALQLTATRRLLGVVLFAAGLTIALAGIFGTIHALTQIAFVVCLVGLFYTVFGWGNWRQNLLPLCFLFFMIPLPAFLHQAVSGQLQLLSSQIGVFFIRLMDISVYLEGNIIDLGHYQLQVLEACDGLRYLFPLMTLGLLFAYVYRGPMWQKLLLFVSTVPITILMNSLRIATIGLLVDRWGTSMAEGFLHDFQGWVVFMVCVAVLLLEAKLLSRYAPQISGFGNMFELLPPEQPAAESLPVAGKLSGSAAFVAPWLCVGLLLSALSAHAVVVDVANSVERSPRQDFLEFPLQLDGGWSGRRGVLESSYIERLRLDDYLLANFSDPAGNTANLYVAWYDKQTGGGSVHSPRSCLPGGGWEIQDFDTVQLANGVPVNRVIIGKGMARQLVYYWFEQRGRVISNEYLVKWHLLLDSLQTGRSDGAMVRVISPLPMGTRLQDLDNRHDRLMQDLVGTVRGVLPKFVPG